MIVKRHNFEGVKSQEVKKPEEKQYYLKSCLKPADSVDLSPQALKEDDVHKEKTPLWAVASDAMHVQGDVVEGLGLTGKALMGSTILTGASAVGLGVHGVMELKEGIKNNDKLKALGGGSTLLAAGESGAEFLANTIEGLELFGSVGTGISQSLEFTARVLGIAHGTIDIILGSKEIIDGIREKHTDAVVNGSFEIGIGSTMIMSGLGIGGPVTAVALGTLFAGKIAYNYREEIAEAGKKIADKIKGR